MANITSCTKCHCLYEAGSEEQANEPERLCGGTRCLADPITILELATFILGREASTGLDFYDAGLAMMGGCEICGASLAAYNACPSKSGFWRCRSGCIDDTGWTDLEEARQDIFGPTILRGREVPADGLSQG